MISHSTSISLFVLALIDEFNLNPTDPEPLYLTKTLTLRDYFPTTFQLQAFLNTFGVEFTSFQLSPRETVIYYSFRLHPEVPSMDDDNL